MCFEIIFFIFNIYQKLCYISALILYFMILFSAYCTSGTERKEKNNVFKLRYTSWVVFYILINKQNIFAIFFVLLSNFADPKQIVFISIISLSQLKHKHRTCLADSSAVVTTLFRCNSRQFSILSVYGIPWLSGPVSVTLIALFNVCVIEKSGAGGVVF